MNKKNGNTRSVGVQPNHFACPRGEYIWPQSPGLFTRIMPRIVSPRNASSDSKRPLAGRTSGAVIGCDFSGDTADILLLNIVRRCGTCDALRPRVTLYGI